MDKEPRRSSQTADSGIGNFYRRIRGYVLSAVVIGHKESDNPNDNDSQINTVRCDGSESNDQRNPVSDRGRESRDSRHGSHGESLCEPGVKATSQGERAVECNVGPITSSSATCGPEHTGFVSTAAGIVGSDPGYITSSSTCHRGIAENDCKGGGDCGQGQTGSGQSEWNDGTHRQYIGITRPSSTVSNPTEALVQASDGLRMGSAQTSSNIHEIGEKNMAFSTVFKNFGHAMATAAKYTVTGIGDVVKFANKAQAVEPGVDLLVGALAGPAAVKISDLAFHALGSIAQALEPIGNDVTGQVAAKGLNVTLDLQTITDIKAMVPVLKAIIASVGGVVPPAAPAAPAA